MPYHVAWALGVVAACATAGGLIGAIVAAILRD